MIAKKNLVLTQGRRRVVEEGDPEGNPFFRVALAGEVIPGYVLEKYGLAEGELAGPVPVAEPVAEDPPPAKEPPAEEPEPEGEPAAEEGLEAEV